MRTSIKRLGLLVVLLGATVCVTAVVKAQLEPAHAPVMKYVKGVKYADGEWKWTEAETGTVKGDVSFARRRPRQPMVVYMVRLGDNDEPGEQGLYNVPDTVDVGQKGAKFDPSFLVLVRKQKVKFLNDEEAEISHNVYFLGEIEADLGIFDKGESREHQFEEAGEVSVHCSIHRRMDGKIYVAPNPAFALVEHGDDSFEIKGVPAGKYRLHTWQKQKRFKDFEKVIEVKANETTDVTVEMTR